MSFLNYSNKTVKICSSTDIDLSIRELGVATHFINHRNHHHQYMPTSFTDR